MSRKQAQELGILPYIQNTGRPRDNKTGSNKMFDALCTAHGLPVPVQEFEFHPTRRWRFDFLFEGWLALEIEGNVWASVNGGKSRHFHGQGIIDDMTKYNEAAILGFTVLRCTTADVESGAAFELVRRALESREE
jgi:hypothetical protein